MLDDALKRLESVGMVNLFDGNPHVAITLRGLLLIGSVDLPESLIVSLESVFDPKVLE